MANKVIPKTLLDRVIDLNREYWSGSSDPLANERIIDLCTRIDSLSGINWFSLHNFLSAVFPQRGLKHDATNEDIYAVLRLLGWEVSE